MDDQNLDPIAVWEAQFAAWVQTVDETLQAQADRIAELERVVELNARGV